MGQIFEEFLQKLLQKPALKGSQLLFLFLKTKDEFTNTYLPDVSLGRLIRDVPRKLMKERGQHLDAFINLFLASTLMQKGKSRYGELPSPGKIKCGSSVVYIMYFHVSILTES